MLNKNYERMGMMPKGSTDVWYTEQLPLVNIHVYTENGEWKWRIDTANHMYNSKNNYDDLQIAYNTATLHVKRLLEASQPEGLEEV